MTPPASLAQGANDVSLLHLHDVVHDDVDVHHALALVGRGSRTNRQNELQLDVSKVGLKRNVSGLAITIFKGAPRKALCFKTHQATPAATHHILF